jgi:hypothetical protein
MEGLRVRTDLRTEKKGRWTDCIGVSSAAVVKMEMEIKIETGEQWIKSPVFSPGC